MIKTSKSESIAANINIGVVGGAISACAIAILLHRAGANVKIFERSKGNLEDRGVGLTMKISTLNEAIRRDLIDADMPYVPVWQRTFGRKHTSKAAYSTPWNDYWKQPIAFHANHWGVLYRSLRKRVPDNIYQAGSEVTHLRENDDQTVSIRIKNKNWQTFDLVICADGYESLGRKTLYPKSEISGAKYFLWRGMIDESTLPIPSMYESCIPFFGYPYGHGFVYYVPSPKYGAEVGKRRVNWAFHETIANKNIPGITPDDKGFVRKGLAPGEASVEQAAYCHKIAQKYFPTYFSDVVTATKQPFIQPVRDWNVPSYVRGRICLMGDGATLSRPHIGGGAGKAIDDAIALANSFEKHKDLDVALSHWNDERCAAGTEVWEMGRTLGYHLVESTPDWDSMDSKSMDTWWKNIMKDRKWFWVDEVVDWHPTENARSCSKLC